jgi:thiamine biosynthesis lipoprotein
MPESETLIPVSVLYRKVLKLMGNRFEISVVSDNESEALVRIDEAVAEISRIENYLQHLAIAVRPILLIVMLA